MQNIILLEAKEAAKAENILRERGLDNLHPWEQGEYQALDAKGDLIGYVQCSRNVATVVNRILVANRKKD